MTGHQEPESFMDYWRRYPGSRREGGGRESARPLRLMEGVAACFSCAPGQSALPRTPPAFRPSGPCGKTGAASPRTTKM